MQYPTLYAWPQYEEDEIAAATRVLESGKANYWTGEEARNFEREFAATVGCLHGIALANGSLALDLALRSLDIGCGDEVIVTPRSFIASASCIVLAGARPVFADVDPDSQNITAETVQRALTPKTKAILCVHLAGWPCDMDPLLDLAARNGLWIVEDCAQAHGALYKGRPVGSLGHVAAWSFCQDKILSTGGEGGMLTTNDPSIRERAWSFKDHGKSRRAVHQQSGHPGFKWLHEGFGTNYRLTEMQAAIGRVQLTKLHKWIERRNANAGYITQRLRDIRGLRIPEPRNSIYHAYYRYYAFVRPERLKQGRGRNSLLKAFAQEGLPCGSGICPEIYREKAFLRACLAPESRLPVARELGETSLMFFVHPRIAHSDLESACDTIRGVLLRASA